QHPDPCRGQFDGQGYPVEQPADLRDVAGVLPRHLEAGPGRVRTIDEQTDRRLTGFVAARQRCGFGGVGIGGCGPGGQRQRRHPPNALLRYVQGLPTGQENTNPGAVPQDRLTQLCQRADRALAGVQEQQCALCPQSGDDRLGRGAPTVLHRVQTVGDRPQDLVVGGGLTQIDEACTVRKTTQDTLGHVQGQAGLADSPRTGQCDHPGTAQETSQVDDVAFTTDEPDELTGGQGQVV